MNLEPFGPPCSWDGTQQQKEILAPSQAVQAEGDCHIIRVTDDALQDSFCRPNSVLQAIITAHAVHAAKRAIARGFVR